jgi:hypothetical protein
MAAARSTSRERTIGFYEIVMAKDGKHERCAQMDFPDILSQLARTDLPSRRWTGDQDLIGTTMTVNETDHLLLHRVKDAGEWLAVIDLSTGVWSELESAAEQGYLDTTAMSFMPYGNVFGMMQGSAAAPSHKSLETWLNGLKIFGDTPLVVRALLSRAEVAKLSQAEGASKVEIRIGSHQQAALQQRDGRLARFLRIATEDYGDLSVTVTITVPRGKSRANDRSRLLEDIRDLADVMPGAADVAKASLVYSDAGGKESTQLAEFVEHHITAKRRVAAVNDRGESIKLSQALAIISGVAVEHESELRLAADVDG